MKKLALVLMLLLTVCGCSSSQSETKTLVKKEAETLKASILDEMLEGAGIDEYGKEEQEYIKSLYTLMSSFDYEVGDEEVNDTSATVKLNIKTFNLIKIFSELVEDEELLSLTEELNNNYSEEKEKELMKVYTSKFNNFLSTKQKENIAELSVPCVKEGNEWKIDSEYSLKTEILSIVSSSIYGLLEE